MMFYDIILAMSGVSHLSFRSLRSVDCLFADIHPVVFTEHGG